MNCYDDPADPDVVVIDACKADGTNALGMARGFDAGAKNGYAEPSEPSDSDDPRDSARSRQPPSARGTPSASGATSPRQAVARERANRDAPSSARLSGEHACDFPAVSPAVVGQPHAFAYAAGQVDRGRRARRANGHSRCSTRCTSSTSGAGRRGRTSWARTFGAATCPSRPRVLPRVGRRLRRRVKAEAAGRFSRPGRDGRVRARADARG